MLNAGCQEVRAHTHTNSTTEVKSTLYSGWVLVSVSLKLSVCGSEFVSINYVPEITWRQLCVLGVVVVVVVVVLVSAYESWLSKGCKMSDSSSYRPLRRNNQIET